MRKRTGHPEVLRVLVVGQTPPPFGGQAVMLQRLLSGHYRDVRIWHVRMEFSRDMSEVGKPSLRKLVHLVGVVRRVLQARFVHGVQVLYYPPSGPTKLSMYRDMVVLLLTRWAFQRTVFHFFASGLSEMYPTLNPVMSWLFRRSYFGAEVGIRLDPHTPDDAAALESHHQRVIPNAVDDITEPSRRMGPFVQKPRTILFAAVLRESKGVCVLLQASAELKARGLEPSVEIMGTFESPAFEHQVTRFVEDNGLTDLVTFLGVLTGRAFDEAYSRAAVFCYPSYFESEASPVVVLEAMKWRLPIVATNWRGIPGLVENEVNGFTVPIRDPLAVANKLELLIRNPQLAEEMGVQSRRRYEDEHSPARFFRDVQGVFDLVRQDLLGSYPNEVVPIEYG